MSAVHPRARALVGVDAYPSVSRVPGHVDLVVVCVPATAVNDVLLDAAAAGVRAAVVVSSGFGELGAEGARLQRELSATARAHGVRLVGPNCLGLLVNDPEIRLNATFHGRGAAVGRPGRGQPVRRGGHRPHGPRPRARPRRPHLRLARQQGRCLEQRPAGRLVRRPRGHRRGALPGVVRQRRQVRAVRPPVRRAQAAARGRRRSLGRRQPGRCVAHRGRRPRPASGWTRCSPRPASSAAATPRTSPGPPCC